MHESMYWTNLSGCIVALLLALLSGHLINGFKFCVKNPQVLNAILVYSISSAVGQNFVYYTLTQFNPLILTTVTTTRKIFSTLFSVFREPRRAARHVRAVSATACPSLMYSRACRCQATRTTR